MHLSSRQIKNITYKNNNSKSIKKGKDTRAHRSPRLHPELERRLNSTPDKGFACASTTKPEPLHMENYRYSVVC
jgi:hypothetical protein